MSTPALLSPIKIGDYELEHRVVLAPLTRLRNTEEGVVTDPMVEYYTQRTTKGGLLITEATVISPVAHGYKYAPGIYTEEHIEGWRRVTDAVHAKGGLIFSQLWHIGRATHSKILPNNLTPVSASAIAINGKSLLGDDFEVPHPLTEEEIQVTIQDFVKAAENAMKAGFDGIEIHGGNGYLIDQFINTSSNKRTDRYGGSIENRARFALEVVDAVVSAIGAKKTSIRLSPWSGFQDMEDDTPVETWSYITQQLQDNHPDLAYIHYIESREGGHSDEILESHESLDPFRKIWQGPFITAGGYTDPKKAIKLCDECPNNLLAFGRIFIANPDLVERIRHDWPLNKYHRPTFYTQGTEGYIDYPFYTPKDEQEDIIESTVESTDIASPVVDADTTPSPKADTVKESSTTSSDTTKKVEEKSEKKKFKKFSKAKCIIS
ncbi:uncharacterized protein BX664DRAFT_343583 [Halteromyces radiatus]|uniref:uncharacterized protein n=1 Tax=Halteromyces radiatus TaxID=101107 RepID=UPI00221F19DE|nr:uncharacterized protein BX664DRAFT_343583 [Halteromyces radiatus]KAI8077827.1 hypothetical protein BX664DRAFT_343583 [Halteromyces radiatus]